MNQRIFVITTFLLALASCSVNKNIEGEWLSENPEKTATGAFGERRFSLGKIKWELHYTHYTDSTLKQPVFTLRVNGKYNIDKPSATLNNTNEAVFHFKEKYITLQTRDTSLATRFGLDQCSLLYNVEKDITRSGCSYFVPQVDCKQEYDLVSLSGEKLYLGARPANGSMCQESGRPVALGLPLKKVH